MKSAWIDIATNVISQNEVQALEMMDHLGSEGRLRAKLLPLLLHEFTHHWCFDSLVGHAALLLRERCRCLIGSGEVSIALQKKLYTAAFRFNAATRLLAPLIEGMALFAEFDSLLDDSKSISSPVDWCMKLFYVEASDTSELIRRWLEFIEPWRVGDQGIARKTLLLSAPLESCPRGEYLRGYLCFRSFHRRASIQNTMFRHDQDLFITYTRHLFFNDPILAKLLIEDPELPAWADRFLQRIASRIEWLLSGQNATMIAEFDERIAERTYDAREHAHLWGLTKIDFDTWRSMEQLWVSDPTGGLSQQSWLSTWHKQFAVLIAYRSVIRLASSPAKVRIDSDNCVFADNRLLGPANMGISLGGTEVEGTVTLYFVPQAVSLLLVVERGNEIVRIGVPKALQESDIAKQVVGAVALFHALQANNVFGLGDDVEMSEMVDWFIGLADKIDSIVHVGTQFWNGHAFAGVDPARQSSLLARTKRAGFGELLNCDRFLLDGLSTISSFAACRRSLEELRVHLSGKEVDLASLLERLESTEEEYGIKLLAATSFHPMDSAEPVRCFV